MRSDTTHYGDMTTGSTSTLSPAARSGQNVPGQNVMATTSQEVKRTPSNPITDRPLIARQPSISSIKDKDISTIPLPVDEAPPQDGTTTADEEVPKLSKSRQIVIAITLTLLSMMTVSGMQALNIGIPTIQKDLGMKDTDLPWIASAYALTNGCLLLLSGRLADVYGRKLLLSTGMLWYSLWTLVGGFMQNGIGMVVSRALAGCGAALATPSATGIIAHTYTGRARQLAFACFGAGAAIGGALGLIIGGIFVSFVPHSWRSALWFLGGLGFAASIAAHLVIPWDSSHTDKKSIDWPGAMLVTSGLILLQYVISAGETAPQGWKTSYIITFIVLGVALIIAFFLWERRVQRIGSKPPLMRLQLWTRANGRLAAVYFIGFSAWMSFSTALYWGTLLFQEVQGISPIATTLRFLPSEISGVICNVLVGILIHRVPAQWIVCTGLLACGIGCMLFAITGRNTNYWTFPFQGMWLTAAGADLVFAPAMIFVSLLSLPDEHSVAGALLMTIMRLGASFGLAISSVVADVTSKKAYARGLERVDGYLKGVQAGFWLAAAACWVGLIVGVIALRGLGVLGKKTEKKEEIELATKGKKVEEQKDGTDGKDRDRNRVTEELV
ncbi:hypothetical protein I302_105206 [Kwoniella bestiolae CBS 10118]|uniref:Major facilitator superfamily (MFS) profile domain-containing protein n=1 Tax=Kwoniella bestiolae CBS 10118 TaxID=1296100 RepID=A0A1B9FSG6_9TREE|nr:hypothetical protein I302_08494 [Kwoniella bestiolae CBS 10118]OCF21717.1 hypothetical protein I302_08494 [Kwoniella bestiolae CBS 10118]